MIVIKCVILLFISITCSGVPLQWKPSVRIQPRIYGGELIAEGQFPYLVSFRTNDWDGIIHQCGGAIISETFILLAAHCINRNKPVSDYEVAIATDEVYKVKSIISHEYFVSSILMNDIALVELATPIQFTNTVQPIELNHNFVEGGIDGIVAGLDETDQNNLKNVHFTTISNEECREGYVNKKVPINENNTLCATANVPVTGLTPGDSGGPFVVNDLNGRPTVAGIVSWGYRCGTSHPSGFTRISEYIEWINTAMTTQS